MNNKNQKIISGIALISIIFSFAIYFSEINSRSISFDNAEAAVSSTNWGGWVKLGGTWQNSSTVLRNDDLTGFSWGGSLFGWM